MSRNIKNLHRTNLEKWQLMHMVKMAESAVSQIVGKPETAKHIETLDAGEHVFHVTCRERSQKGRKRSNVIRKAIVTLNPNGRKATVEWPNSRTGQMNYKVCDLHGLATTSEETAIGE
jgi:hypothetical protein